MVFIGLRGFVGIGGLWLKEVFDEELQERFG